MLWILTREKKIKPEVLDSLLTISKQLGFDTSAIIDDKREN
jgi:lipocalin